MDINDPAVSRKLAKLIGVLLPEYGATVQDEAIAGHLSAQTSLWYNNFETIPPEYLNIYGRMLAETDKTK